MFSISKRRGFTLLELLVVIAIIGIISSVVLTMLNRSRMKSRDSRRVTDLKQIQLAISLYETNTGYYPYALSQVISAGLMTEEPKDPGTKDAYSYVPYVGRDLTNPCTGTEDCTSYHLGANLEDSNALALRTDADADGGEGFIRGADSNDCQAAFTGSHCYDLRP